MYTLNRIHIMQLDAAPCVMSRLVLPVLLY